MSKVEEMENASFSVSKDRMVLTEDSIYPIELLPPLDIYKDDLVEDTAYLGDVYFYLFRGTQSPEKSNLKPGIYEYPAKQRVDGNRYFIVEPITDKDKKEYEYFDKIINVKIGSIVDTAKNREEILVAIPESTKIFQPTLSESDDILKRAAKLVLIQKEVDLDKFRDRFSDKNSLFNFKQVMRGPNRVSILIFNRGCEALNVKYSLVIEEKDKDFHIGKRLEQPIVVSSEDTFDIT